MGVGAAAASGSGTLITPGALGRCEANHMPHSKAINSRMGWDMVCSFLVVRMRTSVRRRARWHPAQCRISCGSGGGAGTSHGLGRRQTLRFR